MYKRTYEIIGLKHWDQVLRSVMTALPLILIGFLVCYFLWWGKKAQLRRSKRSGPMSIVVNCFGFLGLFIMLTGGFFLLPLIAWFEAIVNGIFTVALAFMVVVFLVMLIAMGWNWMRDYLRR
jgi:hypothetical protein